MWLFISPWRQSCVYYEGSEYEEDETSDLQSLQGRRKEEPKQLRIFGKEIPREEFL